MSEPSVDDGQTMAMELLLIKGGLNRLATDGSCYVAKLCRSCHRPREEWKQKHTAVHPEGSVARALIVLRTWAQSISSLKYQSPYCCSSVYNVGPWPSIKRQRRTMGVTSSTWFSRPKDTRRGIKNHWENEREPALSLYLSLSTTFWVLHAVV